MSESDKERSDAGGGASGGDYDKDGGELNLRDDRKKQGGRRLKGHIRRAKGMALSRFRKVKNQLRRRKKRPSSANSGCLGNRFGGCCLGFKQNPSLDSSPVESQTSDPNNPEFSYDLLRNLMEKNDFYSKESSTHLDLGSADDI